MLKKYPWKKVLATDASATAKLLTTSKHTTKNISVSADLKGKSCTVQSCISDVSHRMLEGPYNAIHEHLELRGLEFEQSCRTHQQIINIILIHQVLPGKHVKFMARWSLKNPTRCSGNSEKSWLIMLRVGSNTASSMGMTCDVSNDYRRVSEPI